MAGRVDGKVAIVTGAARGMGRSHCLMLGREGADIAAVDLGHNLTELTYSLSPKNELNSVVNEVQALGRRAIGIVCDVSKSDEVEKMVKRVVEELGTVDILVNNAGIIKVAHITETTEELWDLTMAVNLKSQFLCCKYVLPYMIKKGSGKIINIGSPGGRGEGGFYLNAYCTSKAGVHSFTHALARDVAQYNINVNCVAPGPVNTEMFRGSVSNMMKQEGYNEMIKKFTILGREITLEDVSNAVLFLASEESRNIDGSVIYVDGGHLMS